MARTAVPFSSRTFPAMLALLPAVCAGKMPGTISAIAKISLSTGVTADAFARNANCESRLSSKTVNNRKYFFEIGPRYAALIG